MKNEKMKWVLAIIAVIVLVGGCVAVYKCCFKDDDKNDNKVKITEDEKKFKEEYESLNGEVNPAGNPYKEMSIKEDNNVVYITDTEAVDLMKNETALIYMGFKGCPWCRNLVPELINIASDMNIDKVYYLDTTDVRSKITLDDNNKPQITKGTDAYYELMDLLDDYLDDYYMTTSNGKKVATGEKRIMAPTTVVVKDGVIVGFNVGTVEGHDKVDGVLPDLTQEQTEELHLILENMLSKINGSSCSDVGC